MLSNFLSSSWPVPQNIKALITTQSSPQIYPPPTSHCQPSGTAIHNKNISDVVPARSGIHNPNLGFNLATHVGDDINAVTKNRETLNQFLPSTPYWLLQTHSNNVLEIDKISQEHPEYQNYDAAITFAKNKVCVVLTADCIPILLTDVAGSFVASIHAGRVGVAKNIIRNTIIKSNSKPNKILAFIGPSICTKHYEVGKDILDEFTQLDSRYKEYFHEKNSPNKFDLDLNGVAVMQLLDMGLLPNNICQSNICTYCNHDKFFSYRYNKNTGRFASLIWIS